MFSVQAKKSFFSKSSSIRMSSTEAVVYKMKHAGKLAVALKINDTYIFMYLYL